MKLALIFAAMAAAAYAQDADMDLAPVEETTEDEQPPMEVYDFWADVADYTFYTKSVYEGLWQGLYASSRNVEKIDPECFGTWISEDAKDVENFFFTLIDEFWTVSYDLAEHSTYDMVDLVFKNERYCHFRDPLYDVWTFCSQEPLADGTEFCSLDDLFRNLQMNAFSLMTQISQPISTFKSTPWAVMDVEQRGYALKEVGHSVTQIFVDLVGFKKVQSTVSK